MCFGAKPTKIPNMSIWLWFAGFITNAMNVKKLCCHLFFSAVIVTGVACQKANHEPANNPATLSTGTLEVEVAPVKGVSEPVESTQFEVKGLIKKVKKE